MRPNLLTVPQNETRSFDLRHEQVAYFTNPWHFHPELELNFVVASAGTRFIGQSVEQFDSGEIVLLGKNLPHYWRNEAAYYKGESPQPAEAIVARFNDDFLGKDFFTLSETRTIQRLFDKASCGLKLKKPLYSRIADQLYQLTEKEGFVQLMAFLNILYEMATHPDDCEIISPNYVPSQLLIKQNERLSKVITHLIEHFTDPVSLNRVAELANMNEAAFCRYFKAQTGKTLTQYLTDLRIQYACDLLSKGEDSVTQVCYQVGFENVSHFIQAFKKQRHQTPFEFRKQTNRLSEKG
ncbi:AraC family transcriptional regulator [Spirosoma areae]